MSFYLLIVFALLPSLIWLIFFLKRDKNPEPRWLIARTFMIGALMVIPAIGAQYLLNYFSNKFIVCLIIAALIEEVSKYGAAFWGAFHLPELDEPIDAMIYMITAGLGFAAMENLLVLVNLNIATLHLMVGATLMRFLTATFIHALSSGLMGYFISFKIFKKRKYFVWIGLIVATAIHAAYNLSIFGLSSQMDNYAYLAYTLLLIIPLGVAILDIIAFAHLKK